MSYGLLGNKVSSRVDLEAYYRMFKDNESINSMKKIKPQESEDFIDMGSIEIEIDGEADPEMVLAEVKEIIEERKRKLQENNK